MNNFFKKIVGVIALSLFILVGFAGITSARSEMLLFGENHFYTVNFRGNGEATVYAKMAITNSDEKPLTEYSFEVPNVSPTEMVIYQMKLPQECVDKNYSDPAKPCLEYRDPDYTQPYYSSNYSNGKAEYQKINYTKSENLYKFTLPTSVEPNKSSAIIVAYATKGYVKENAGLYKFNFETLKVSSRIKEIKVAVDVDGDLLLKGKQSSVNYNTISSQSNVPAPSGISSVSLDKAVGQIGSNGLLTKTAIDLSPNESLVVKGEYARGWFRLYLSSILLTILTIIVILTLIYFLARFLKKRKGQNEQTIGGTVERVASQNSQRSIGIFNLTNASMGLLSVVCVVGLTYLLKILPESNLLDSFDPDPVFLTIMVITVILMYLLVIIGPAIIIAIKHGWKSFLSILIAEFLWLVIFLIVYSVLFQAGGNSYFYDAGPRIF